MKGKEEEEEEIIGEFEDSGQEKTGEGKEYGEWGKGNKRRRAEEEDRRK